MLHFPDSSPKEKYYWDFDKIAGGVVGPTITATHQLGRALVLRPSKCFTSLLGPNRINQVPMPDIGKKF